MAQHGQHHPVYTDGRLNDIGGIRGILLRIEVLNLLAGELLVVAQVEVGAAVDTLQFLEAEGEVELNIGRGVGVVGQFLVIVETVVLGTHSQVHMPLHAGFLPFFEPFQFRSRFDEELHFHLLEFTHAENELSGYDFVTESFPDLGDTERNLHTACFLHVQVVHENTLGGLRTQINQVGTIGRGTHGGGEHQVELTDLGPVAGSRYRADDVAIDDDLAIFGKVVGLFSGHIAVVHLVPLGLFAQDIGVGRAELGLVEGLAEFLASLCHLFFNLLFDFAQVILDQDIGAIAFFGIFVVDQRVVKGTHVAGSLPNAGVHEDGGIDPDDVLVQACHRLPPVIFDVVFELNAHLSVVIYGGQSVVNLTGRENKSVLFAMCNQYLEKFVLRHIFCCLSSKTCKFNQIFPEMSLSAWVWRFPAAAASRTGGFGCPCAGWSARGYPSAAHPGTGCRCR